MKNYRYGSPSVMVGVPVCRAKGYIFDAFMKNQKEILKDYPGSWLTLASSEPDYCRELRANGYTNPVILSYPASDTPIGNIVSGREALREYAVTNHAEYFLSMDEDLIAQPDILKILLHEIKGYDAIYNAVRLRQNGAWGFCTSCLMLGPRTLYNVRFRFHWLPLKNGHGYSDYADHGYIAEDAYFDHDCFLYCYRVKKGIYAKTTHYRTASEGLSLAPGRVPIFRKISNDNAVRFFFVELSRVFQRDVALMLHERLNGKNA